jgi:hypothetical protein
MSDRGRMGIPGISATKARPRLAETLEWPGATSLRPSPRPNCSAVYLMFLFKASCVPVKESKPETACLPQGNLPLWNAAAEPDPLFQSPSLAGLLSSVSLLRSKDREI